MAFSICFAWKIFATHTIFTPDTTKNEGVEKFLLKLQQFHNCVRNDGAIEFWNDLHLKKVLE